MKKTERDELRACSVVELEQKIDEARRALLRGRISQVTEGVQRGAATRNLRRDIARMQTIIQEKSADEKAEVQA